MNPKSEYHDPLLQPFQLKHLTLRNRIISTSHACGLEESGLPLDRYQTYHEEKARGGIALSMFGGSSNVSIDSPSMFQQLDVGVDEIIPHLQSFSRRMHTHGAALMCQITHLGRRGGSNMGACLPTIAPSVVRETLHRSIPKEIDDHDISRVVGDFAQAARRCKEGGLDGIETLAGAHLIGQFLSPATNRRVDHYGGSLENRCRFGLEVFEAIRREVGDDFLVGFRFVVDEGHEAGLDFEECLKIAGVFERSGTLDFFNAIYGRMDTAIGLAVDNMPGMASPMAPWLEKAGAFRNETGLPVFHAARISDVATARHAIGEGLIDLVGMTRAQIADPHLVEKLAAAEEIRIRPCVGATHCMSDQRPSCIHNPATGQERVLDQIISPAVVCRRVVVVGAGPAGLEAARVCGERGHIVTVLDAASRPGGQILLAANASWRKDLIGIVDWRVAELERLGVELQLNVFADADLVMSFAPDLVIIATGGTPNLSWLPGHEHLTSAWDILGGTVSPGDDVLVIDGTGRHVALSAAEKCQRHGSNVQFATIDEGLALDQTYAERVIWRKWVHEIGLPVYYEENPVAISAENNALTVTLQNELTGKNTGIRTSQVIYDYGTIPAADIYFELRQQSRNQGITDLNAWVNAQAQPFSQTPDKASGNFELHRIGDAVSSRDIHAAVTDALRLCQSC
ncbi:MAG: NADH:flavin oxidoreductase [Hyphomicrobiales bacterium]|nr:NADH:flavin oxidoreductase [Hyphomicrobiales bacterium]